MSPGTSNPPPPWTLREKVSAAYARNSRDSLEEKWILENLPLVRHIVQKVAVHLPRNIDTEDLMAAGMLGLVKAARAFDPTREAEFGTYAYIRVHGAVIDELRGRCFVPSSVRRQIRRVQETYRRLLDREGNPPSDEQLAAELGISQSQLYRTLEEGRKQNFLSIHGLSDEHSVLGAFVPAAGGLRPDEQAERKEALEMLAEAIKELPERDRVVLLLYYERDLTMKETAQVLQVTESRVSQLHAGALFRLSMRLRTVR